MTILTKIKKLSLIARYPELASYKNKHIFLLSHMRSRSSVLSHIIGTNLDIYGYSELHRSYLNQIDLFNMRVDLFKELKPHKHNCQYFFDKILGNWAIISNKLFRSIKPKVIFLIREPESTFKSIVNMGHIVDIDWYKSPVKILDYYCSRLDYLEKYAESIQGKYFFIESDDLINNTGNILSDLSKWLNLKEPLKREYSIFQNTGKPGFGDPSNNIKSGKIEKTKEHVDISIPHDILEKGELAYERCKASLIKNLNVTNKNINF